MLHSFESLIGRDAGSILWWQMVCRGALVFLYTLFLVRVGGVRVFGKHTSFDIVLGVMLGSIMSRSVTGNAPFLPSITAATALVLLHWLLTWLTARNPRLGHIVKGHPILLVKNGHVQTAALAECRMTEHDLMSGLRCSGGVDEVRHVKAAFLERNGQISVVPQSPGP